MERKIGDPGEFLNDSMASRAANIKPDMRKVRRLDVSHRSYRKFLLIGLGVSAGLLGLTAVLFAFGHLKSGFLALIVAGAVGMFALRFRQMLTGDAYTNGLLIPGVITSTAPLRVAILAAVENGGGPNPRGIVWGLKQLEIPELTVHPVQVGERVPCVALFGGDDEGVYTDFEPRPLAWGTDNPAVIAAAREAIDLEEWEILEHLVPQAAQLQDSYSVAYFTEDLQPVKRQQPVSA